MIHAWGRGAPDDHMAESILVALAPVVRAHPWWRARTRLTVDLLDSLGVAPGSKVLDAGCGWGATLDALERRGDGVVGLDVSRAMLERLDCERPGRVLVQADLAADWPEAARTWFAGFDAVLALDVIEHLDDDRAALARLARMARPGGVVVVSVPALPELTSAFDAIQGHRRRYRPDTLRTAFEGTGLDVDRLLWWGAWMVPVLRRQRARTRAVPGESPEESYRRYLRLPPWPLTLGLRLAFTLERPLALAGKLKTGTSLFAVARARP